jgi:hypothetical protein
MNKDFRNMLIVLGVLMVGGFGYLYISMPNDDDEPVATAQGLLTNMLVQDWTEEQDGPLTLSNKRTSNRSQAEIRKFRRCIFDDGQDHSKCVPYPNGRKGYVGDHILPICAGGPDKSYNMQWQTIEEAKIKDKYEMAQCREMKKQHLILTMIPEDELQMHNNEITEDDRP